MKGYFLFAPVEPECVGPESGIERKVRAQHSALRSYTDCELVILSPVEYTGSLSEKILRRLPFTAGWRKWGYRGEFDGADFVYIRQVYHDSTFVRYLRDLKRKNPAVKILYEVPTYPYDAERKYTLSSLPFAAKEKWGARLAAKYMDRIVTFYGQETIWGVPCIRTINGFDFSSVKLPRREASERIPLISVAQTASWHGYDRVIEGLHRYYADGGREDFVYHMVGSILPEHKEAVEKYGLSGHVVFHGRLSGEALARVFAQAKLGIDVLGGHRKDLPVSSSLKSREYAAYGLPILTSSPVDYLPREYPYQFLAPYDDSPLDMQAVAAFYHGIYDGADCGAIALRIRAYAQERCDMRAAMKKVAEYILERD